MDSKMKHLEFIQGIISRMGQNSFLIKGWCVTLVSALFALAAKDSHAGYVIVSYVAIPTFWMLDGFFIATERRYVNLYEAVAAQPDHTPTNFSLNASGHNSKRSTWIAGFFSKTLLVFYPIMIAITLIVAFILSRAGN